MLVSILNGGKKNNFEFFLSSLRAGNSQIQQKKKENTEMKHQDVDWLVVYSRSAT